VGCPLRLRSVLMAQPGERSIEELAAEWLGLERLSANDPTFAVEPAREASAAYDEAVAAATPEELLLAWRAAQKTQGECEMGSREWVEARSVSELLRMEYAAAASAAPASNGTRDAHEDAG
jgi:hypothetical protein